MIITVKAKVDTEEDRYAFNDLNVWCAKNAVRINSVFTVKLVEVTMDGDDLVMADMLAHLKEKQYGL